MENKESEFGQVSELEDIIQIALNGSAGSAETNELLADLAKSNSDTSFRIETKSRYQDEKNILEFKLGEQTVKLLTLLGSGSDPYPGIEIVGQDTNGLQSSVLVEPLQKYVLEKVINN